jgi:4-alpha-glucanotransferase
MTDQTQPINLPPFPPDYRASGVLLHVNSLPSRFGIDYFSKDGQLWGNPVYDWDALRRTGFRFFIDRLRALLAHADVIRLDHFHAFVAVWNVPADAQTARIGHWMPGPGPEFFYAVRKELGALPFISEDLGLITPDVCALRDDTSFPLNKSRNLLHAE